MCWVTVNAIKAHLAAPALPTAVPRTLPNIGHASATLVYWITVKTIKAGLAAPELPAATVFCCRQRSSPSSLKGFNDTCCVYSVQTAAATLVPTATSAALRLKGWGTWGRVFCARTSFAGRSADQDPTALAGDPTLKWSQCLAYIHS